jgi:hypothetical protein
MDWFAKNAASIQAIASIAGVIITAVLAGITWWYVRVTRDIAASSAEQVRQMRALALESQERSTRGIEALASRLRSTLAELKTDEPSLGQLMEFTKLTEADIVLLDALALQTTNALIIEQASGAISAMRELFDTIQWVKKYEGRLSSSQERNTRWKRAREQSDKSLHAIEDECARLLKQEAA